MNSTVLSPSEQSNWTLPLFIHSSNKYLMGFCLTVLAAFLYLSTNHIHLFAPQLLPMTWIDRATPFIPQTVFIYLSEYLLFFMVFLFCRERENMNRYAYAFLSLQTTSVVIFTFWPTTYPRELFPLPQDLDQLTWLVFGSLRDTDTPASCCPSLHVSSVYLSSFMFLSEQRRKFPFFFLWATAIAVTTLTTKQHYLVDVVTGFLMSVIFYWIFKNLVTYREPFGAQAKR